MKCPKCGAIFPNPVTQAGGRVKGASKARTHEQAQAAGKLGALKRWGKPKKKSAT